MISIGQLARETGVTVRSIRHYEELGLLPPPPRSPGGRRRYPGEYRGHIAGVLELNGAGLALEQIKPLLMLATGRPVSTAQRDSAGQLLQDGIVELARQMGVLWRWQESMRNSAAAATTAPDTPLPGHPGGPAVAVGPHRRILSEDDGIVDEVKVEIVARGERWVPLNTAERQDAARMIVDRGGTPTDIATRLHVSGSTARLLYERAAGQPAPARRKARAGARAGGIR
jgi:DNA-binding transcriptional MerR regulator